MRKKSTILLFFANILIVVTVVCSLFFDVLVFSNENEKVCINGYTLLFLPLSLTSSVLPLFFSIFSTFLYSLLALLENETQRIIKNTEKALSFLLIFSIIYMLTGCTFCRHYDKLQTLHILFQAKSTDITFETFSYIPFMFICTTYIIVLITKKGITFSNEENTTFPQRNQIKNNLIDPLSTNDKDTKSTYSSYNNKATNKLLTLAKYKEWLNQGIIDDNDYLRIVLDELNEL